MHQPGFNDLCVKVPACQNFGNGYRVRDVGEAGVSELAEMSLVGISKCFTNFIDVGSRQINPATVPPKNWQKQPGLRIVEED